MKKLITVMTVVLSISTYGATNVRIEKPINVDGTVSKKTNIDDELQLLRDELVTQEDQSDNYQEKSTLYKELKGVTKKMIKSQRKYVKNRFGYQGIIKKYNSQADCEANLDKPECRELFGLEEESFSDESMPVNNKQNVNSEYLSKFNNAMLARIHQIKNCYQSELDKGVRIEGEAVDAYIKLIQSGTVEHIGYSSNINHNVINCISAIIRDIDFPRHPVKQRVTVKQRFNFNLTDLSPGYI